MFGEERVNNSVDLLSRVLVAFSVGLACVASVSVGFSAARSRRFSLFGGAKIGASATLIEAAERGRGGEKRKRLPANPMILKNAPLTLLQLDKFTV